MDEMTKEITGNVPPVAGHTGGRENMTPFAPERLKVGGKNT